MEWYGELTVVERITLLIIIGIFSFVMHRCWQSLKHSNVAWHRGFHTTPVFQILMWIGAGIFMIPLFFLSRRRKAALASARFIANIRSRIYHKPDCEYQIKISSDVWRYPLLNE